MHSEIAIQDDFVRERAYAIWEQEGRPEGREFDHWVRAIHEISAAPSAIGGKGKAARPRRAPARRARRAG